jgi:hypothetical protein
MAKPKPKTKLDPEIQSRLIELWLPRLQDLKRQRQPLQRLMIAILLVPLVSAVLVVAHMIYALFMSSPVGGIELTAAGSLLGLSCFCFLYLGKIQACNDQLVEIEFALVMGDQTHLRRALSQLTCMGAFKGIFSDAKRSVAVK